MIVLRPLFDKHVHATTIIDGVDLIHRLDKYVTNGYLKPTTYLCTFDITDLYTMLPQQESIDILTEFLLEHGYHKVKGILIDAIRKLGRTVLTENAFIYDKKFYKQIIGGAMGSAFTLTLVNIFMWKWEKELVRRQATSNEIYGRYIDDIFFTSNQTLYTTNQMIDKANMFHPNIKLVRQVGTSISFLDILIENKNGILTTSVYHKEAAEPYIVPIRSDHPAHVFKNIAETALLRAMRCSSTLDTFNKERRSLQLMLLYNGYPPRYIYQQCKQFFAKHTSSSSSTILSLIEKEDTFVSIRTQVLQKKTILEQQLLYRLTTITDNNKNEQTKHINDQHKLKKQEKWNKRLILHYKYEQRLSNYKKDIHQLWNNTFIHTPIIHTKLIIGNRNNYNAKKELVSQRQPILLLPKKKNESV